MYGAGKTFLPFDSTGFCTVFDIYILVIFAEIFKIILTL